jgi:gliding motility-associated-like protein
MKKFLLLGILTLLCQVLSAQSNFIRQDLVQGQSANCTGGIDVCIDSIVYENIANYRFFLDGTPFTAAFDACTIDTLHAYSYLVIYQDGETRFRLDSWAIGSQTFSGNFNNLDDLLDSMNRWDPMGNWQLEPAAQIIFGFPNGNRVYGCQNITGLTQNGRNEVCYNPGFQYSGMRFKIPSGTHQFVAQEILSGMRDTVTLRAACIRPDTVRGQMTLGDARQSYCVDVSELLGTAQSTINYCPQAYTQVNFSATSNNCINFSPLAVGIDTACIKVCDQYGFCDSTTLIVTINPRPGRFYIIEDTVLAGATRERCDFTKPAGAITSFRNDCPTRSGSQVNFALTALNCVSFTGVTAGSDTACVIICNGGDCDTTHFYIRTVLPAGRFTRVTDTITIGLEREICALDAPSGATTRFENVCAASSGTMVGFTLDPVTRCVRYTGRATGTDTACIVSCNAAGVCDTAQFIIRAIPPRGRFVFLNDTVGVDSVRSFCSFNRPVGPTTRFENICSNLSGRNALYTLTTVDLCVNVRGLVPGYDTACIVMCNEVGTCDTTILVIRAKSAQAGLNGRFVQITDTISVGLNRTYCGTLRPVGAVARIENICASASGTRIRFSIDTLTRCVTYEGLAAGTDTACYVICNADGECDTTRFIIRGLAVASPRGRFAIITDTVVLNSNRAFCTINRPTGAITRAENICSPLSGREVVFSYNAASGCIEAQGLALGIDTACYILCNAAGTCDTTIFVIETKSAGSGSVGRYDIKEDTISIGTSREVCNYNRPTGQITRVENVCPTLSGSNIRFSLDTMTYCLRYEGLSVGYDTACVLVCNVDGVCDTTQFIIQGIRPRPVITASVDTVKLKIFEEKLYCPDSTELRGSPITLIKFCDPSSYDNVDVRLDQARKCVVLSGRVQGVDTFCVALCNQAGFCDTTRLFVQVSADTIRPALSRDTVYVYENESSIYCGLDSTGIRGSVDTVYNACPNFSGTNAQITIDPVSRCLVVRGLRVGTDTACLMVCNLASGLCAPSQIFVVVLKKPQPIYDTVRTNIFGVRQYCLDTTELRGSAITRVDFCTPSVFDNAQVSINAATKCISIRGTVAGADTACFVVCNAQGLCDTTYLSIFVSRDTVRPTRRNSEIYTPLGRDTSFCNVDTLQIGGVVDTIYDACLGSNGGNAVLVINRVTKCVKITPLAIGSDTMCIVVCNRTTGLCDTTELIVYIQDTASVRLKANDDFDSLRLRQSKIINLYANDSLYRRLPTFRLLVSPTKGTVMASSATRGLIEYRAGSAPTSCGLDSLVYEICVDSTRCDTATLTILINCPDSLRVWQAFSPNGDGDNETFQIDGLQNYPNHELIIFNRWGNEVLKTKNYQNDWRGTWRDKELPDGTYFYWVRNEDTGEVITSGYVQIMR